MFWVPLRKSQSSSQNLLKTAQVKQTQTAASEPRPFEACKAGQLLAKRVHPTPRQRMLDDQGQWEGVKTGLKRLRSKAPKVVALRSRLKGVCQSLFHIRLGSPSSSCERGRFLTVLKQHIDSRYLAHSSDLDIFTANLY